MSQPKLLPEVYSKLTPTNILHNACLDESMLQKYGSNINHILNQRDCYAIGSIVPTMLTESQWWTQTGDTPWNPLTPTATMWVLADGRDVTGSLYSQTITGTSNPNHVPNCLGRFLRGSNNGRSDGFQNPTESEAPNLGDATNHSYMRDHIHSMIYGTNPPYSFASRSITQAPLRPSSQKNRIDHSNFAEPQLQLSNNGTVSGESRPHNMTINYMVRINNHAINFGTVMPLVGFNQALPSLRKKIAIEITKFKNVISDYFTRAMGSSINNALATVDLQTLGEVEASVCDEAQFQAKRGTNWILADGRNVGPNTPYFPAGQDPSLGSRYYQLTGKTNVPDMRGFFLRMRDRGRGVDFHGDQPEGTLEQPILQGHNHAPYTIINHTPFPGNNLKAMMCRNDGNYGASGSANTIWGEPDVTYTGSDFFNGGDVSGNNITSAPLLWGPPIVSPFSGGSIGYADNAPIYVRINFFVKVN